MSERARFAQLVLAELDADPEWEILVARLNLLFV